MDEHNRSVQNSFARQAENFETKTLNFSRQEYLDYMIRMASFQPEDRVLEVAAGTCACGRSIAPLVKEVTCLDLTPQMLEVGKREAEKGGLSNIHFVIGDAEKIPFADQAFDAVISRLAFHHMEHPEKVFAEMSRVLAPGGRLVLIDMESAEENLRDTSDKIERMRDPSHVRNLSSDEMLGFYGKEGLEVLKCERIPVPVSVESWMELTQTEAGVREQIRSLMEEDLNGGARTGFQLYRKDGTIYFRQRWIVIVGRNEPE